MSKPKQAKSYSIWLEAMYPESIIQYHFLGAYIGTSFPDACKRACWDRFGMDSTQNSFKVKNGIPYYSSRRFHHGKPA